MPEPTAETLVANLAARRPDLVALARLASIAAIVEQPLLRRLRLEVGPQSPADMLRGTAPWDAGLEADLWFSKLAQVATSNQLTLHPDVLEVLRSDLATRPTEAEAVHDVVVHAHRDHPDVIRLEERIIWSTLQGDSTDVGAAYQRILSTLHHRPESANGIIHWYLQARRRLPTEALRHDQARRLAAAVALHVDRVVPPELLEANRFPDNFADLVPRALPTTRIGVQLTTGGLRFVPATDPDAAVLDLPDTRPLVAEVTWNTPDAHTTLVKPAVDSSIHLEGLFDTAVLRTITGVRYRLNTQPSRRIVLALFGNTTIWPDLTDSRIAARLTELVGRSGVTVEVVRNPSDISSRPEIVVIGSIPKAIVRPAVVSFTPRFAEATQATKRSDNEPLARVVALSNATQDILSLVIRWNRLPIRNTDSHIPDEELIIDALREVLDHPQRLYILDVDSAITMLQSVASAFHVRALHGDDAPDELSERGLLDLPLAPSGQPASDSAPESLVTYEHVRLMSEYLFAGPVREYLSGAVDPILEYMRPQSSPTSFAQYLHWFVDHLRQYAELLGTRLPPRAVPVGFSVPLHVLQLVRSIVGNAPLPRELDQPGGGEEPDSTSYSIERAELSRLIRALAGPILDAVDQEVRDRVRSGLPDLVVSVGANWPTDRQLVNAVADYERLESMVDWYANYRWPPRASGPEPQPLGKVVSAELFGLARQLSDLVSPEFWNAVHATGERVRPRPPLLELVTRYPEIPWELTEMNPAPDPSYPPFLGCQTAITVSPDVSRLRDGRQQIELTSDELAVLVPDYSRTPGVGVLPGAEREAQILMTRYGARRLPGQLEPLLDYFRSNTQLKFLHVAGHSVDDRDAGLILENGERLTSRTLISLALGSAPFVYIGMDDSIGLADACLRAGATAVVAPLWSVGDSAAMNFADEFYRSVLEDGVPPAEVLRRARCTYETRGLDNLAYRYYGNRSVTIEWTDGAAQSPQAAGSTKEDIALG